MYAFWRVAVSRVDLASVGCMTQSGFANRRIALTDAMPLDATEGAEAGASNSGMASPTRRAPGVYAELPCCA